MSKAKIELTIVASKTSWNNTSLRWKTTHRGPDGKVRATDSNTISNYKSGAERREALKKALEQFISLFNLFVNEAIEC